MTAHSADATAAGASVDPDEVARFAALADLWWDATGEFAPLHKLNPVRLRYIRDRICGGLGRDPEGERPLDGLRLLDIGCGGGLLAEPLTRLGARVTGIDAAARNIGVATAHARASDLDIDYRCTTAEALAAEGHGFDVVLNMEIVEHVADLAGFLGASGSLLKPDGTMVVATLNRTPKAFMLAIVGAEYVLRWLPRGSHDWRRFVRPSELSRHLAAAGLTVEELTGVVYSPFADRWRLDPRDLDVNYMALATR